jgi:hypothetical protein
LNYIFTMRALARRKIDEVTASCMTNCEAHLIKMPEAQPVTTTSKHVKGALEPVKVKDAYILMSRPDLRVGLWINHENTGYKTGPIDFGELIMHADWPKQY